MMEMRCHPASFSRSRRIVIWKHTETRQCRILPSADTGAEAAATEVTPCSCSVPSLAQSSCSGLSHAANPSQQTQDGTLAESTAQIPVSPRETATALTAMPRLRVPPPQQWKFYTCLPSVEEKGEPEAVELVRDFWIEERKEPTDIIHAVHLGQKWVWRGILLQAQGTLHIALEEGLPSLFSLNQVPGLASKTNLHNPIPSLWQL